MATNSIVEPRTELLRYAESNMWSSPYNDQQFRLAIKRISPSLGSVNTLPYMGRNRGLPEGKTFYHVFTLSGFSMGYWNFINKAVKTNPVDTWIKLSALCHNRGVHVDLYKSNGRIFPRDRAWVMRTYDGAHLIAVEKLNQYPIAMDESFYLRCYSPDWPMYHGEEGGNEAMAFDYFSALNPDASDLTKLQNKISTWSTQGGLISIYANGIKVKALPSLENITTDMFIEVMFDPTVYRVEHYKLSSLLDFYSTLDQKRKLIIHPPKEGDWGFRYFDDCDFYIANSSGTGLYFNVNSPDAIRQLTHRDYSIASDYVSSLVETVADIKSDIDKEITVIYRSTRWGYDQGWEHNRIKYLYRMTDDGILGAMTAVKSTLPEWNAAGLESSMTMEVNRSYYKDLSTEKVAKALGFNGMTEVTSKIPVSMPYTGTGTSYPVPYDFQETSMAFEYDAGGLLLSYRQLANALTYIPQSEGCSHVEFIAGTGGINRNHVIGNDPVTLRKGWGYQALHCGWNINSQSPDGKWKLAVEGTDFVVTEGVLSWKHDTVNKVGRVLFNDAFLFKAFDLTHIDNSIYFAVTEIWDGGGIAADIPPANILLWMNNRSLIENVDYVIDYPRVYVFNKQFISSTGTNSFVMAAYGLSTSVEKPINESELGYIVGGRLGVNNQYNLRDDRVTRIVCDGRLFKPGDILDSEQNAPSDSANLLNGRPYGVKHLYQTIKDAREYDSYPYYAESRDLDERVCAYLTEHLEKPGPTVWPNIQDKYRLFSIFLNQIVNMLLLKVIELPDPSTGGKYSNQTISEITADYQWMLKFDPVKLGFDKRYFSFQPYSMPNSPTVNPKQLLFITQVNELYLGGACFIEGYFEVNPNV